MSLGVFTIARNVEQAEAVAPLLKLKFRLLPGDDSDGALPFEKPPGFQRKGISCWQSLETWLRP